MRVYVLPSGKAPLTGAPSFRNVADATKFARNEAREGRIGIVRISGGGVLKAFRPPVTKSANGRAYKMGGTK